MKKSILIKQHDVTDCGAACIASVAAYHNLMLPLARIRQYAGTDQRGTNILGLIEAAELLGLESKGVKGPPEALRNIPLPAIIHVITDQRVHHYLVLYKANAHSVSVMDPSDGKMHKYLIVDFLKQWTGVIILMVPSKNFKPGGHKKSVLSRFFELLKPHRSVMLEALTGAFIFSVLGLSTSVYVQKIIDFVLIEGNLRLLNLLSVGMIILLIFQMIIGVIKTVLVVKTGQQLDAQLILGYYKHLLNLPQRFFDTMRVGEIISRVNDAVKIRYFINDVILSLTVNLIMVACATALMFFYYWKLAMIMLASIPSFIIIYYINNLLNRKWQRKLMEDHAELETQLVESLHGASTIKQFRLEAHAGNRTENRFIRVLKTGYTTAIHGIGISSASELITRTLTIVILWTGSYFVVRHELSPGELLSFYSLIGYFTGPVAALISSNKNIQEAVIAADRLFEIIDLESEKFDTGSIRLKEGNIGDISFQDVEFRYNNRTPIFMGLTMNIEEGKFTAIVGESGSGKSTVMALIQKLYPLKQGSISFNTLNIQHIALTSLREKIAAVPQQIQLFSGTIADNIAIGESKPDMHRIVALCTELGMNEFIEAIPGNYFAQVGERGANLSGGQKQRIAIARACYKQTPVLLLDEPSASLDPSSEYKLRQYLKNYVSRGNTAVLIAHRLSTVANADMIFVMHDGKIVENGTHEQLIKLNGKYASLWNPMNSFNECNSPGI